MDQGRHGGIAALRASPFNLLGRYNDDPAKATAEPTRHVEPQHRNWGEFRVPSLRNVARDRRPTCTTAASPRSRPSCATIPRSTSSGCTATTARAWCGRCGSPPREVADLVTFLETLSGQRLRSQLSA